MENPSLSVDALEAKLKAVLASGFSDLKVLKNKFNFKINICRIVKLLT